MTTRQAIGFVRLVRVLGSRAGTGRTVTANVGAPGSGKSTLAEHREGGLDQFTPGISAVLPMAGTTRPTAPSSRVESETGRARPTRSTSTARCTPPFDLTAAAVVLGALLRDGPTEPWEGYGLSPEKTVDKVENSDLPNGRRAASDSVPAGFAIAD